MSKAPSNQKNRVFTPYLTAVGAWALAFGCAVGWGSFVMPGNTFLPVAGPIGTAIGIGIGALFMLLLSVNYHYLINLYPDAGGIYSYTKRCFGYDHGFLSAWFLILTYIAIIWANASALPLIARTLLGSTFQFGFHYEIAGFHLYLGEILLAVVSLLIGAGICMSRRAAQRTQIVMAVALFAIAVLCFAASALRGGAGAKAFVPEFAPDHTPLQGTLTIFALAPWAFVGFESVSHSASEFRFPVRKTWIILTAAVVVAGAAYAMLALLAVTALPEGTGSWLEYVSGLSTYSGEASIPTLLAAHRALGGLGRLLFGLAALGGIITGLVGHFIASSRLIQAMGEDGMMPEWIGRLSRDGTPANALYVLIGVSAVIPFFGRTAISWIVDVTTIGATLMYGFVSAAAWKSAKAYGDKKEKTTGIIGSVIMVMGSLPTLF